MKNWRSIALLLTSSLAFFLASGCYKQPPPKPVAAVLKLPIAAAMAEDTPMNRTVAPSVPDEIPTRWADLKDYTFDEREKFFAGLDRLNGKVDAQVLELKAKRAKMNSLVDTKEWDFAMKEMNESRSYLNAVSKELRTATPETWEQDKEKAGQAWERTQEAYDKVKSSTTS